jgi:hypothetical protein
VVAVNGSMASAYRSSIGCDNVLCEACLPGDPTTHTTPYLRVDCVTGHCIWTDTRRTEATACSTGSDCILRNGLSCCEWCGTSPETLVAVNRNVRLCEPGPACPPCVAMYPAGYAATCQAGHCAVVEAQTAAGNACATASDCGSGFACSDAAPAGYCVPLSATGSSVCNVSASICPAGTTCAPVPWSQVPGVCMRTCTTTSECRVGQECNAVQLFPGDPNSPQSAEKVCWPACSPGMDQTCNDNPILSSIHGACQPDGSCVCGTWGKNPETGRCL